MIEAAEGVLLLSLVQEPKQVHVLRHDMAGVAIVAVSYKATCVRGRHKCGYFTIVELPLGGFGCLQTKPRVSHVPLPLPPHTDARRGVTSLALLRSVDGETVYVIVQCYEEPQSDGRDLGAAGECHIYRRIVQKEDEEAGGAEAVTYQRMPHQVNVDGRVWTAACGVHSVENAVFSSSGALSREFPTATTTTAVSLLAESQPLVVAASGGGFCRHPEQQQANAVQWISMTGATRAECRLTIELAALSGFEVIAVIPVPGCGGSKILLVCHHVVVEVCGNVAATAYGNCNQDVSASGKVIVSSEAIRRSWCWSPHDRLTACCVCDAFLLAGTEEGNVIAWDMRQLSVPNSGHSCATAEDVWHANITDVLRHGVKVAVTGIYAPHSMAFLTGSLDGSVLYWTRKVEGEGWEGTLLPTPVPGESTRGNCGTIGSSVVDGVSSPASTASGCVAMAGDGSLAAVVRELGELEVYWCP